MIRRWTRGQWVLRSLIVGGVMGALFATVPAGALPAPWLTFLVLAVSLIWAVFPDSAAGTGALLLVVIWWGVSLRDGLHPAALLAATGMLLAHVCAVLADLGPGTLPVARALVGRWLRRGLAVWLAAPVAWGAAVLVRDQPAPAGVWLTGLGVALVALAGANLLLARRAG